MINVLRKNQKALWIVIAVLCIPFVFYFSNSNVGAVGQGDLGKVYGRSISRVEFQHNARLFSLARDLGMFTLLQELIAGAQSEGEAYLQFTMNRLILHHEAERLGIRPATYEVANVVKGLRQFRGDKGFDPAKYNEFVQNALAPMGFDEAQIEELARDQLTLDKIKELIGAGVHVSNAEAQESYNRSYGKLTVALGRLRAEDFAKDIQISDDDIAKYYEAHKAELTTEEKRKVNFVTFGLNEEQKKLAGKERVDQLQKLADQANDFNQALLEKGAQFNDIALRFQLPIQATGEFTRAAPDPQLAANPQLAESAFQLTPEEPTSDAIQASDSFYVLHLSGLEAARPLTLEEAKPKIVEAIRKERTREMLASRGNEAARKIREALASGAAPEAAIQQAGLKPEKPEPFGVSDPPKMKAGTDKPEPEPDAPDMPAIKTALSEVNPGEVTDFVPTESGGFVAVLERRDPPEAGPAEQTRAAFNSRLTRSRNQIAFYEWMRERRREAGIREEEPGVQSAG